MKTRLKTAALLHAPSPHSIHFTRWLLLNAYISASQSQTPMLKVNNEQRRKTELRRLKMHIFFVTYFFLLTLIAELNAIVCDLL